MFRILSAFIAMLLLPFSDMHMSSNATVLRAMLIGGDTFVTQENTYPIAKNNLESVQSLLESDYRGYEDIQLYYESISAPDMLSSAVQQCLSSWVWFTMAYSSSILLTSA